MSMLSVRQLGKCYHLFPTPKDRLKEMLTGRVRHEKFWALRDVDFEIRQGESLGIVGDNGAGKSTLLKLIAGTIRPTRGSIGKQGRLTAILELGSGFHPEFSGRENLYFSASLMGISREEISERLDAIIDFSELGEAIDRPIKSYSSGMVVRLAFALVTSVNPDILVIDEALAVGDQHFQQKSMQRMQGFREQGCTILFCSHSMYHIKQLCSRAAWIDKGRLVAIGDTAEIVACYEDHVRSINAEKKASLPADNKQAATEESKKGTGLHKIRSVELSDIDAASGLLLSKDLVIQVDAESPDTSEPPNIGVLIERNDEVWINGIGTHLDKVPVQKIAPAHYRAVLRLPDLALLSGEYLVSAYLFDHTGLLVHEEWLKCDRFKIVSDTDKIGLIELPHVWEQ